MFWPSAFISVVLTFSTEKFNIFGTKLKIGNFKSKLKFTTIENISERTFIKLKPIFSIFRSVKHTWASRHEGYAKHVDTWARWAGHLTDSVDTVVPVWYDHIQILIDVNVPCYIEFLYLTATIDTDIVLNSYCT